MNARAVHIIDDDMETLESIAFMLGAEGIETTTHDRAQKFLAQLPELKPGCILLDLSMPEMDGIELQKRLHEIGCRMPVIIVTGHGDITSAVSTMKHGAVDFIQKPFCKDDLITAVTEAWAVMDQAAPDPEECQRARDLVSRLTRRERQVLDGLVKGQANKVIAYELDISPRTVELYRANAMRRLSARSLSEMLHLAFLAELPVS